MDTYATGNVMSLESSTAMRDRLTSSGSVLSDESDFFDIDDNAFEEIDPRLRQAASRAAQEKQITPLIKEELRLSILSRRNKEGKGDVVFEEKQAPAKRSLTPQEKERKLRRQEQNRRAARRCRKKKKDTEVNIMKAYYAEKDKNHSLNSQVEELRKEKEKLDEILRAHLPNCPLTNQTTTVSQPCHTDKMLTKSLISPDTSFQYPQNRFDNGPLNSTEDEMDTSFLPADFDESVINQDPFDECCSNIDIPWRRQQQDIQGALEPLNLDSCYGSEQENTDIRNIIESCTGDNYSTDDMQFRQPQATQSSAPQSECTQQPILTDSRITMGTSVNVEDTLPETLSGLEGIVSLLYAQSQNDSGFISYDDQRADVDIAGSLSNLANISDCHSNVAQSWETTTSYTELNDIVHNDLCQP